jgi:hypothetical protein
MILRAYTDGGLPPSAREPAEAISAAGSVINEVFEKPVP